MRPRRTFNYPVAFLAASIAVVATPAANRAFAQSADDPSTDSSVPAEPAPEPEPTPPTTEPTPEPEPEPEPPTTTPEPEPEPPTTEPTPEPEPEPEPPTTTPTPEPEPEPTTPDVPETSEPSSPQSDSPTPSEPDQPDQPAEAEGIDGITREISFPVLGTVQYANGWGDCRDGCARRHVGTDMLGARMQPLLAAVDGTITRITTDAGISGNGITVTGADGWYYNYFHVNNDTPGTDDGLAEPYWQVSPKLTLGSHVRAGQVIGYMGDSGNAEGSVPHLHFEIRTPGRVPVNPYPSLVAAQERETCATEQPAWTNVDLASLSPNAIAVIPLTGGGRWVIDTDGRLYAEGAADHVQPVPGIDCDVVEPIVAAEPKPAGGAGLVAPVAQPAPSAAAPLVTPAPTVAEPAPTVVEPQPAPAPAPAVRLWTVEPGESLWSITQTAYQVSDTARTVALVDFVFDHNRDKLSDPGVLNVGTTLELHPIRF